MLAAVAVLGNLFIAPASLFQNGYLEDERGYSAALIAAFTLATATPAGIGLIVGGRVADVRGRRRLIAVCVPVAATLLVVSYSVGGPPMWLAASFGGIIGAIAFPALAVYRNELFPTGSRSLASFLVTAAALLGGIVGLVTMGALLDRGRSHGAILGSLALAQIARRGHRSAVVSGDSPPRARGTQPDRSTAPSLTAPPHLGKVRVTPTSGEDPCQRLTRIFPRSPMRRSARHREGDDHAVAQMGHP